MDLPVLDMQPQEHQRVNLAFTPGSSHHPVATPVPLLADRLGLNAPYSRHSTSTTQAAYDHHAGQAMHMLALPPPNPLTSTSFGQHQESFDSPRKVRPRFSPVRTEQHGYPSPPMSDSTSPASRSAHLRGPETNPYHPTSYESRRIETLQPPPLPPPPPAFNARLASPAQGSPHNQHLYASAPSASQPLQYQPGRAIEPPYFGSSPVPQSYPYGYAGVGVPPFLGRHSLGSQGRSQGQSTALLAPPSLRASKPARRTKQHVASACVNCKKAHLSCDIQRPCGRCIASGKQESCKDVLHKKRGRPRLRDDKDFGRNEDLQHGSNHLLGPLSTSVPESHGQQSVFSSSHSGTDPLRVLNNSPLDLKSGQSSHSRPQTYASVEQSTSRNQATVSGSSFSSSPRLPYPQPAPVAFLDLDFVILKCNQAFQDLVSLPGNMRGKNLHDLMAARSVDVLQRIKNGIRDERDHREPSYMAPITPHGYDPMQAISEGDVDYYSQGYTDWPAVLTFQFPNGHHQALQTQIRLAKTSLFFVTLVVHTPLRPTGPPLLTQQLAPPTPTGSSHSQSAPTTAPVKDYANLPRPLSSAGSAPTSPYFNFNTVRTSLPATTSSSYGSSPSMTFSPSSRSEQGYFPTIQPPTQTGSYPSPYPPLSRTGSVTSGPLREPTPLQPIYHDTKRPVPPDGLQLPPIRTTPISPTHSARRRGSAEISSEGSYSRGPLQDGERSKILEKRRRLNIHEVLE